RLVHVPFRLSCNCTWGAATNACQSTGSWESLVTCIPSPFQSYLKALLARPGRDSIYPLDSLGMACDWTLPACLVITSSSPLCLLPIRRTQKWAVVAE
ncbi:hypothetical protein AVEN_5959-1, partial [Araneus ventricosus]